MDLTNSDFKFFIVKNIFIFFKLEKKYNITKNVLRSSQ